MNWHTADADFGYWATVGMWSLDESVALLLGKSPSELHWKSVQPFVGSSDFAKEYDRVRTLALKSEAMNRGQRPVPPSVVLEWAAQVKIDVPPELTASMQARQAKKLAIAALRRAQTGGGHTVSTAPAGAAARIQETSSPSRQSTASPGPTVSPPVLKKVIVETLQQRRNRLSKRREQLKLQGVRELGKRLASEEGVSPKRVRAILKKPKSLLPR